MDTIKHTDKYIGNNVYLALSAYYDKRYAKQYRKTAKLIAKSLPYFHKLLKIPKYVQVRLAPIKGKSMQGRYHSDSQTAVVEVRFRTDYNILSTLAHELVHAEQFHCGRLSLTTGDRRGWVYLWNGEPCANKGTTYERYRNQPWEKEAFDRQTELAVAVAKELDIELPVPYNQL
jgi:hypothetical protein